MKTKEIRIIKEMKKRKYVSFGVCLRFFISVLARD